MEAAKDPAKVIYSSGPEDCLGSHEMRYGRYRRVGPPFVYNCSDGVSIAYDGLEWEWSQEVVAPDDPLAVHMSTLATFEAAGLWEGVHRLFHYRGRRFVQWAVERGDKACLGELARLRDRLVEALAYEEAHGRGCLVDMAHPLNATEAEIGALAHKAGIPNDKPKAFPIVSGPDRVSWMEDWRTFDFRAAMS